jgi:LacI family transcriptional regulator
VSRVINGGAFVKPETYARVMKVIEEINFQPSQAARSLRAEHTHSIGIVLPTLSDPFFAEYANAARQHIRARGFVAIIVSSDGDVTLEEEEIASLIRHRVAGLVTAPSFPRSRGTLAVLRTLGRPVIAIDHEMLEDAYPCVITDNRRVSRDAVKHLISHGHRQIGCIPAGELLYPRPNIPARIQGYRDAIRAASLTPMVASHVTSEQSALAALETLFSAPNPPTAFFTTNYFTTRLVFSALKALGKSIPEDIALIGFDDFEMAPFMKPTISVVKQPTAEYGRVAIELLFRKIENPRARLPNKTVIPSRLELRESCGCHAGGRLHR